MEILQTTSWKTSIQRCLQPARPVFSAVQLWLEAGGMRMSAAMTFYGLLSLSPLVLLIVGLLGWWVDRGTVESTLLDQVRDVMGERGVSVVQAALASAQAPEQGRMASVVAFFLLLSGATGVFVELQNALDKLWQAGREAAAAAPQKAWWKLATLRLRGLAYVLIVGFLMLVSMVMSAAIQMFSELAQTWLHMEPPSALLGLLNDGVSFVVMTVLFVGLMRIGTGAKPRLRYLVCGALVSSILFLLSKQALAWYLSKAAVVSAYGAAGSLVVVLIWIYVASAILLLGASFAKALELQAQPAQDAVLPAEASAAPAPAEHPPLPKVPGSVGSQATRQWPEAKS